MLLQEWQRQALDAMSVWLVEDTQRMEPKLLVKRNIGILVAMFREAPHKPLERLIKPFKDMLTCSPKLCTHFSAQVCHCAPCCLHRHAGSVRAPEPHPVNGVPATSLESSVG